MTFPSGIATLAGINRAQTWTALQTFKDTTFKVVDDGDATKTLVLSLGGATAGADLTLAWAGTADRTVTIPDATSTLAALSLAQTFDKAQTIAATTGTSLSVTPPAGTTRLINSTYSDSSFVGDAAGSTLGIWNLAPTLSGAGINTITSNALSVLPTWSNAIDSSLVGIRCVATGTLDVADAGASTLAGLTFRSVTAGSTGGDWLDLRGSSGTAAHNATSTVTTMIGYSASLTTGTGAGNVSSASAFRASCATTSTMSTYRGLLVQNPTGSGSITTAIGVRIDAITFGSTNYAIDSAGGQSRHVGNFFIGAATNPTAKLHLGAGTTAASTAPLKFTSGSLMTTPEAGAVEFLTDKLYFTATTGPLRRELANEFTSVMLLGSATIDMQTAATTTIYTTPASRVTRISHVVVRDPTASLAGGTSYTITGLRAAFSLAGLTTANTGFVVVRAADLVEQIEVAASTAVQLTVTTGSTAAANATLDVFGYVT